MIDMHMHSCFSEDGEYTPEELVCRCAERNISLISVADHNCAKANIQATEAARLRGIQYIPGIEIDCVYSGLNFHVLGYGIDYTSQDFADIEDAVKQQCLKSSLERLEKTQALGFALTEDDLRSRTAQSYWSQSWPGELFAEVLLEKPEYKDSPILLPYREGGSRSSNPFVNFYWDFYAPGRPCSVEVHYPDMMQVIGIIHRNHGVAVLAHPGVNLKDKEELLPDILSLGMDGIEAFSSYHTPSQAFNYYQEARVRNLLVTCGSDFHGKTKPAVQLGKHGCLIPDDEKLISEIVARIGKV